MRVVLSSTVFERISYVEAALFLWFGGIGRHRVMVEDAADPRYSRWLAGLPQEVGFDWAEVLNRSLTEDARHPSAHEIRVEARAQSSWGTLSLTVGDALDLLGRPYRILVENGFSDRDFLLSSCARHDREWVEERIAAEWVEVEHCGGKEHLRKLVTEMKRERSRQLRASALFDGDGLRPGRAGNQSIADLCHPEIHHHMLGRRSIENYLPRRALERWARLSDGRQEELRLAKARELFEGLSHEQRAHYNVKEGFGGDERHHQRAPDLYEGIATETRRLLQDGFGETIARVYREQRLHHDDLDQAARDELGPFIEELLARIR